MDEITRLHCLAVMGIQSWVLHAPTKATVSLSPMIKLTEKPTEQVPLLKVSSPIAEPLTLSWQQLQIQVKTCQKCSLARDRIQTVFGSGDPKANWLFIGEAPGEQEDLQGLPFVGRAGALLTEMLRAIGLEREQVYIANIVKCRPPNNRDPNTEEIVACQSYLNQQISQICPKVIIAVGRVAAHHLLKTQEPLSKLRGKVHYYQQIPLIVIYHPAYLLRSLTQKRKAWEDLQFALNFYQTGA